MVSFAGALGSIVDVCHAIAPIDLETGGGQTGARLHLTNYGGTLVCVYSGAGTANDD